MPVYQNRSVGRVLSILELLGNTSKALTLTEIARGVSLDASTAYRALRALCERGFVYRIEPTRRYVLSYNAFRLGSPDRVVQGINNRARMIMVRLAKEVNETIRLAVLEGANVLGGLDCLHRIGKLDYDKEIPIIPSPAEFGYRLRAQWHIDGRAQKIGYYRQNSRDLIAIDHCPILQPELDTTLQRLRAEVDWTSFWPDKGAVDAACGTDGSVSLDSKELGLKGKEVSIIAASEKFTFAADVFFQGNKFLIDTLIDTAIGTARGQLALDLYCGVGLFTLPLARRFERVVAVEEYGLAVDHARKNAAAFNNIEILEKQVGRYLAEYRKGQIDFALLDPPRSGTEKKTVLDLIRLRPRTVSYVSCDPSVLARDLRRFLDAGYQIDSITAIDLFPQTHHVETILRLVDPIARN